MKESFLLYHSFREPAALLNLEDRGRLWDAIFSYQCGEKVPELPGAVAMAFAFIRNQFERDAERWKTTIEARRKAGRLGGLSRAENAKQNQANQANATFAKQNQANQADTVSVTVTDLKESKPKKGALAKSTATHKFVKPNIEEVTAYCRERGNAVDSSRFYDHYESNGWRVGKNAMRDWKAAVRTWERQNGGNDAIGTPSTDLDPPESITRGNPPSLYTEEEIEMMYPTVNPIGLRLNGTASK